MAGWVIKICSCVALRALCQLVVASNCCCLSDYYCCNNASIIEVALKRIGALHNSIVYNSLETRYLCLLKWSGKMLQNLKSLLGFSCSKTMVEAFFQDILSNINLTFLKSDILLYVVGTLNSESGNQRK